MTRVTVECLSCGRTRMVDDTEHALGTGSCPRCGYVGWAHSWVLTEDDRRALRELPVELRRLESPFEGLAWRA